MVRAGKIICSRSPNPGGKQTNEQKKAAAQRRKIERNGTIENEVSDSRTESQSAKM